MFTNFLNIIFPSSEKKILHEYTKVVKRINDIESVYVAMSDATLQQQTEMFKDRLKSGNSFDDIIVEAMAVFREGAKRVLLQRPFDVQLIGAMVLHNGGLAEMQTGEGKTLVAAIASYLNALSGTGVHVVTVNDYLVKRDGEWMGKVHDFLGLTVGYVTNNTPQHLRKAEYAKDIVYVTNSEIGFDYLRDNMKINKDEMCLLTRGFNFAIIDEADSILIDEARTPLIISGPAHNNPEIYVAIDKIVMNVKKEDYEIDEKHKSVQLTDSGNSIVEAALKRAGLLKVNGDLYDVDSFSLLNHILQALKARFLFKKNIDYIVNDNNVFIVDEFTGRVMEGRRYSDGLHQAIEAKEGVKIMPENQTLASITYQNFFRMYKKLGCMTGTAKTEAAEFKDIYNVDIVSVATNRPVIREDLNDLIFKTEEEKFEAIANAVKECAKNGQPVLIGTVSIEKSEKLSAVLKKAGVKHNVLNAKNHEKEAEIIAEAGCLGAVTIATNMAGRGTDIMLGGNLQRKVDNALSTNQEATQTEKAEIIAKITQEHAKQKADVIAAGGLFVIGSERHESRRIDNQLRGRSGRQGDVGKARFYLSLRDDLLRIFGGDKIDSILSKVGFKPGEVLEHPMLNRVISGSQVKVENFHYEMRKNVLKYDDIINQQRHIIYDQRMLFIESDDIERVLVDVFADANSFVLNEAKLTNQANVLNSEVVDLFHNEYLISKNQIREIKDLSSVNEFFMNIYKANVSHIERSILQNIIKEILIMTLDECWREHLYGVDHIRSGIHLRSFAQKDPFTEYKIECFKLFEHTMQKFAKLATQRFLNVQIKS